MTLKELRLKIGFTQNECAEFLGITTRSYQNYENDNNKINTQKYIIYYNQLEEYWNLNKSISYIPKRNDFYTNVIVDKGLEPFISLIKKYKKRECYNILQKYIYGEYEGKVCILYGLRRTGKTTLLFQMINELPLDKTAYIKIQTTDTMANLTKDLNFLNALGYKYIFIDEITLLEDFINTAAILSDVFSIMGMKIVLSGTDSLGFAVANRDELYDRNIMIHTSYISFKEYSYLLDINSIDKYIEYGGTLKIENMSFDDPESIIDEVSFRDDESTRKYIDTAISRNIQRTLKNDHYGEYFNQLREIYDKGELTNVINRIVENMNHNFLLKVIEEEFKSHDLGSAKNILLHDAPDEKAYVLENINREKVINILKKIIDIKETYETTIKITQEHIDKIRKYLILLDLIINIPVRYESGNMEEYYIFTQPGMRYSIAKALVYSLLQDQYFNSISEYNKTYIINKILEDVKGRMLEDIVLLEINKSLNQSKQAFKFKFDLGGEFDMIIYDKEYNNCEVYEIKHSDKINNKQYRHLMDQEKCELIEKKYGDIIKKIVLYRGKDTVVDNIQYLNVEKYLKEL